ncbi:MAG: hypothetical protein ACFCGT_25710 [Sandaracinaceae bacterium]
MRTIGVDEIRPGMTGYGLTVFRGTTPERFEVEVIDVLHNFRPGQDLILVRTLHPILEHATTVGGMSGSPIYLDGRLAGAYAYGWSFGQDPVVGVTPIRNMLAELRRPARPDALPGAAPVAAGARGPARLAGLPPYRGGPVEALPALRAHAARQPAPTAHGPRTAATPLLLGGFEGRVVRQLEEALSPFGMVPVQAGGGGGTDPSAPRRYVDGGAVGVQLIQGDIDATAVGTVTHIEGNRGAAFGHPMLNAGEPGLPTAVARVLHILASRSRSFKIAEAGRPLGTLVQDRQAAIVLETDRAPDTVALELRVQGVPNAPRTAWSARVASHRALTPALIGAAIANAVDATASDVTPTLVRATSRVHLAGEPETIEVQDVDVATGGVAGTLGQLRLFPILEAVYGNPFQEARVERVEVDLEVTFDRTTVRVVDAATPVREVDPGSEVPLRVVLQRFGEPEAVRVVPVRIPERLAGERVEVLVEAGSAVRVQEPFARSLGELLANIRSAYGSQDLVISLKTPSRGLRFGGHVVRSLPPSALDTLQQRNDGDRARPFVTYERSVVPLDAVVSGSARIELAVRSRPRR